MVGGAVGARIFVPFCMGFSDTSPRFPITEDTRFLILHTPKTFHKVSPFLVQKLITSFIGDVKSTKKLPSGDLLIETSSKAQIAAIQKLTKLGDFPVEVTPHRTLNFSRGVISDTDLFDCSETELVQELRSQKVCAAHRIKIKRNGTLIPTKHVILTFSSPELPKFIRAGYVQSKVKPYVPNPLRCFKCQRFGHSQGTCRGSLRCAKCSADDHETSVCSSQALKCLNCSGPHPAYSRDCPKWKMEKEIQSLKVKRNITYAEARKFVLDRTPKPGLSYSGAMKSTLKCTGSQTEITDIITTNTCSCKHLAQESVKINNFQKTETSRNQASTSTKNSPPLSQSKDSEFSLARFPKKKRKKAKSPSAKRSDTEIPPKPPDIPTTSDSVLSICPSTSDISDVEMDQHFPNKSPPGGHT
ncbi:uncharacterized protein LOC129956789 [Argiope bruennichi]|uniref:uncharacterized protein LOC129956789 n=1 Tax=Argiope bruennichi TaxID=94029 RepID=UPI002494213E|nr:uncharacterized protein LOC129956789 [Argiope bruennichi]